MLLEILNQIDSMVWGPWLLILLLGTGILFTLRLGFIQIAKLPLALRLIFSARNRGDGDIDSFKALCTALAATVGTGNIVGVATAIKAGGPGALFWMWMAAFFGMATKYAEGCLAVRYREVDSNGEISGGPMYYIEKGLGEKWKPLAILFAVFGVLTACLGSGTYTQANAIMSSLEVSFGIAPLMTDVVLTILVGIIILGGLQSIAKAAEKIVPAMAVVYIVAVISLLIINREQLPMAIELVFVNAFTPTAAMGGFLGASVMKGIQSGIARGIFSNESGLGSAPIVAAAAKTKWPAEQGLISMTGTFIDTIIICTMTGLAVISSGLWTTELNGAVLTNGAFSQAFPLFGDYLITIALVLFAFTTILGWSYYGERCAVYLFGTKVIKPYRLVFIAIIATAAFLKLEEIWALADIVNGLMAFPNLVALLLLSGTVVSESKRYMNYLKERSRRLSSYKNINNKI
ncbi:alanine/glycine:cation symporter family protein [Dialister pneumosintes]|uniref:Sodium:alanine symporter n=1 Tax=Dialister pneumosintes TaxID=39950 RepID=A0A1B3WET6_9FIRM|nr:sodium:alanine symporter family protein [Dialister pneumosintes]AOH39475.1 sodium:alanine symporter [Dialister pneumosintes]RID94622.1 sodium:alanine symporter family protein [Dialister pneumosintes]